MDEKNVRSNIYELFYRSKDCSLIDLLNNSSCDEVIEVDLNTDSYKQIYHVKGKYSVPILDTRSSELFNFVKLHVVHPDDIQIFDNLMNPDTILDRLKKSKIPNFDFAHFRYKLQNGDFRYVEQCVITGQENGFAPGVFRLYVFDIHNLMTRQSGKYGDDTDVISDRHDSLTGLLTRNYFFKEADEILNKNRDKEWCLVAVDIEHFKFFDEWYGRETGSFLLAKVGAALLTIEKQINGIAGYFGQDDFYVLSPYDMDKINKIFEIVRDVIISFDLSVGFMPALGVAVIDKKMMTIDAFDRASIAANKAKSDIRNRICLYDPKMQFLAEQEYRTLMEYMDAFKKDEITFYLQPQCRISTGQIVGAESLARWVKPDGSIVPPNKYIPILEKYGFITDLDQRLWEKVCMWLRSWLDQGHQAVPISVNVSRADIFTIDIAKYFLEITEKYNIPHNLIKIEITESAYTETTGLIGELVKTLRENGFMVLMDDFGSGYSSLNMLSNLKVDAIKLDANFLHIQDSDYEKAIHILESVVNMAKQIALPIIVEGVENQEQSDFLAKLGCQYVQGFHYYRPIPVDKFEKIIRNTAKIDDRGFVVKHNEQFRTREFLDENVYSDSMLNNIIGSVAFYSWREEKHIDIVRFNQQFYESVGAKDFNERLVNIETFVPPEDQPKFFAVLKNAMENKLGGASEILRFYKTDGTISSFSIHFYYLGKKEGGERFYGSAHNVTELVDLREEMKLIAEYSDTNLVFISRRAGRWVYTVASHGLADVFKLSPRELQEEMNSGRLAKRVVDKEGFRHFMLEAEQNANEKKDFVKEIEICDADGNIRKLQLSFVSVAEQANNIEYLMFTHLIN